MTLAAKIVKLEKRRCSDYGNEITIMSTDEEMRRKMAAIGARYLARTATEIDDLQKMVANIATQGKAALKDIEILAHRIRGSGAVFGYVKLSEAAGVIEMFAMDSAIKPNFDAEQLAKQFTAQIAQLALETQRALGSTAP